VRAASECFILTSDRGRMLPEHRSGVSPDVQRPCSYIARKGPDEGYPSSHRPADLAAELQRWEKTAASRPRCTAWCRPGSLQKLTLSGESAEAVQPNELQGAPSVRVTGIGELLYR
jgi:hypothetical protein